MIQRPLAMWVTRPQCHHTHCFHRPHALQRSRSDVCFNAHAAPVPTSHFRGHARRPRPLLPFLAAANQRPADLAGARALGDAILLFTTVPWALCALAYTGLHVTYPRDRRRAASAAADSTSQLYRTVI